MATIQEFTAARNITSLVHFTKLKNLDSILQYGLLTPQLCEFLDIASEVNDRARYDGQDAVCLSIEFPNYQLYWSFHNRDTSVQWAIVELHSDVLWLKNCCFCTTNAADSAMSAQSFESRQGLPALEALYQDYEGKNRADLKIPDNYTTNPQAEVLCIDAIDVDFIKAVHLDDYFAYKHYSAAYPLVTIKWSSCYFKYRCDWRHW